MAVALVSGEKSPSELTKEFESHSNRFAGSSEFHDAIRAIGKANGYYSWSAIRYFVYEYEQDLRSLSKTTRQLLTWEDYVGEDYDTDHKTIEHIYPQKASDPYWRAKFEKYSVQERNTLRNSIGNLLPVSHPKNASLSNKSFLGKKGSAESQVGYMYGCLSEIQVSLEDDWDAVQILRRGITLLSFMERRWALRLGTDQDKLETLGLSFVLNREGITLERVLSRPVRVPTVPEDAALEPVAAAVKVARRRPAKKG